MNTQSRTTVIATDARSDAEAHTRARCDQGAAADSALLTCMCTASTAASTPAQPHPWLVRRCNTVGSTSACPANHIPKADLKGSSSSIPKISEGPMQALPQCV